MMIGLILLNFRCKIFNSKPKSKKGCSNLPSCPLEGKFILGEWSPCSVTCGKVKTKKVKYGMLRLAFLRVGEDISLEHILLPPLI